MDTTALTAFDIAVLLVVGVSVVMAFSKGFATVALSLLAWVATILAVVFAGELITPYLRPYVEPEWLADTLTYAGLFIGGLFILKWLASLIGGAIKNSPVGFLDRSLGALFGLLRGMVLVSALYFGFTKLVPGDEPSWVQNAQTRPLVAWGSEMLASVVGGALGQDAGDFGSDYLERAKEAAASQFIDEAAEELSGKYQDQIRQQLDDLVEEAEKDDGSTL
ncbi:MAG: CvpA family protein [Kordiimonadaceae bacterium]|nr:CvpA family protein [Kordiimonadaceae bacterium]MBO6570378.1 CvpA family protein [Kordiimonadaceae bacterium]MBO6965524.1 CvpA family protein [Kordiimonadaceae bacterium]